MNKSVKHWYPRYPGDYRTKTAGLSLVQHGAYTLLLDEYYNTEKPLPAIAVHLHRVCSALAPDEQEAVDYVLANFFTMTPEGYTNKRVEEELAKRADISNKRKKVATDRHAKELAKRMQTSCKADAIAYTSTSTSKAITTPKTTAKKKEGQVLPLPEWLPKDDWNDYIEMRDKKGKGKATFRAKQLVIMKLMELKEKGHEPDTVLQQSIINGWTSVFEIKKEFQQSYVKSKYKDERETIHRSPVNV